MRFDKIWITLKTYILSTLAAFDVTEYFSIDTSALFKMGAAFIVGLYLTFFNVLNSYIWNPADVPVLFMAMSFIRSILESITYYRQNRIIKIPFTLAVWLEVFSVWIILSMAHNIGKYDTWKVLSVDGIGLANGIFLTLGVYYFVSMAKTLKKGGFIPDNLFNRLLDRVKGAEDFVNDKKEKEENKENVEEKKPKAE